MTVTRLGTYKVGRGLPVFYNVFSENTIIIVMAVVEKQENSSSKACESYTEAPPPEILTSLNS